MNRPTLEEAFPSHVTLALHAVQLMESVIMHWDKYQLQMMDLEQQVPLCANAIRKVLGEHEQLVAAAVAAERERCAKIVEKFDPLEWDVPDLIRKGRDPDV